MMISDNGMNIVTVRKNELLDKLRENRDTHVRDYNEMRAAFEKAFVKAAEELLKSAQDGNFNKRLIDVQAPESHEKDYSRIIKMLEMSVNDEVQITDTQFQQYVEDDWSWKGKFEIMKTQYAVGAVAPRH